MAQFAATIVCYCDDCKGRSDTVIVSAEKAAEMIAGFVNINRPAEKDCFLVRDDGSIKLTGLRGDTLEITPLGDFSESDFLM